MKTVFTSTGGVVMGSGPEIASLGASTSTTPKGVDTVSGPAAALQRAAGRCLRAAVGDAPISFVLPSGEELRCVVQPPVARLVVRDVRTLIGLVGPSRDLSFGDAYATGKIEIEGDLLALLEAIYRSPAPQGLLARAGQRWRRLRRRHNSPANSRENVHYHYDLGNEFYALWLDREMIYTCAYFRSPDVSLEEAQLAKMEHVARKLRLQPGETVVEAGCGWGALALYLARHHGVRVRAFNISREQIFYARARARAEGLTDRVEFIEDDYRNVSGRCDAFVSVGMLEHVGPEHYADLGRVIDRTLGTQGRGLLHFIGRNRPLEFSPWVERRIFPGAYPPTLREMAVVLEPADLSVLDVENLRPHYARTLEHWLARFEARREDVARQFDTRFVRTWRLYLAGSITAFRTGSLQLFQVLFARGRASDVAWTREHLYAQTARGEVRGAL